MRKYSPSSRASILKPFFKRRVIAHALIILLYTQAIMPPALALPGGAGRPSAAVGTSDSGAAAGASSPASRVRAASHPVVSVADTDSHGIVLTRLGTASNGVVGIDYHQPLSKVIVSANSPTGEPNNFELIEAGGSHRAFSNISGLAGELKMATARDEGQGASLGGFRAGEVLTTTGAPGVIARIAPDGSSVQNSWVTLPREAGQPNGLCLDRTGVFAGDLIVVTTAGGVWRVKSGGAAAKLADLGTRLSGVVTVPDYADKYGPWAGKILAGAKDRGLVYAVDAQGASESLNVNANPEDLRLTPAHENFYAVDPAEGKIWGAPAAAFTGLVGDVLVAQESPGQLTSVRWNGAEFEVNNIASTASMKQVAFAPAGVAEIPAVMQVYEKIAVTRHAPALDGGRVEGSLWQLLGEAVTLDGRDTITSDLLVPGTPDVTAEGGNTKYGGTVTGTGATQPAGYAFNITGSATLRHLVTRTNPISLSPVSAPPAPAGTRDLALTQAGQPLGDPSTLRHLSLSGKAGEVSVPPGTYGRFTAGGHTAFVLGVAGSAQPSVYNLESLTLTGGSELRTVGPVLLTVGGGVTMTGSTAGPGDDPRRLVLQVSGGALTLGGGAVLYAVVRAPQGTVSVDGKARLRGTVSCDRLRVVGGGVLQVTEGDLPAHPVNRYPTVSAGPDQTITLPNDTVTLGGAASDDGLPEGGALTAAWSVVQGPGAVTFADQSSPTTTATFTTPGTYVLRLTANDTLLVSRDDVTVTAVPRNRAPEVKPGEEQAIELPASATLAGAVSDDALPRGSTVTVTWSKMSGPGAVAFEDAHSVTTTATFSAPGTYTLALTADDTELTTTATVDVLVRPENHAPNVSASGPPFVALPAHAALDGTVADDGLPEGAALTSLWTKVSGPGEVAFADPASPDTTVSFTAPGVYTLRLTADDTRSSKEADVVVEVDPENHPPSVNPGPAQTVELPGGATLSGTVADDNYPRGSTVTQLWTKLSGPGEVAFADPTAATTAATFGAPGEYKLLLTATDTALTTSSELLVTVHPENQPPTASASADSPVRLPAAANLAGSVADDGWPAGGALTSLWTKLSGPGDVTFADAASPATKATFGAPGTYVLRLTASDTRFSREADVTVVVLPANVGPTADAGPDRLALLGLNLLRNAGGESELVEDRIPFWGSPDGGGWTRGAAGGQHPLGVEGVAYFMPSTLVATELRQDVDVRALAAAVAGGAQRFAFEGYVRAGVGPAPEGSRVVVEYRDAAGAEVLASFDTGEVTSAEWVRVSDTRAAPAGTGWVRVRLVGADHDPLAAGGLFDGLSLRAVSAAAAALEGAVTDDGLPAGPTLAATWAKVNGPGEVWFADASRPATTATFDRPGTYILRLTADDSEFSHSDEVTVTVGNANLPPTVSAGADAFGTVGQPLALNGSAADDGLPEGAALTHAWTKSGGPGAVAFADAGSLSTAVVFDRPGQYALRLTAGDSEYAVADEVRVTVDEPNAPPVVSAGADRVVQLPAASFALEGTATDDGLPRGSALSTAWSVVTGPVSVTFEDPAALSTRASFAAEGTYVLRLTATDSQLSAFKEMTVRVLPAPRLFCMEGDDFDDGVRDPAKWLAPQGNAVSVVEAGGRLTVTPAVNSKDAAYNGYVAATACDMTNMRVSVEVPEVTADVCGAETYFGFHPDGDYDSFILISKGCNATVFWYVQSGQRAPLQLVNNSLDHRFWRIGHDAATNTLSYDTSADRVHWVTQMSVLNPFPITQLRLELRAGTYSPQAAPGRAVFDNLMFEASSGNLAPAVNAGPDLAVTIPHAAALDGSVADDGVPLPTPVAVKWTKVTGPGAVTFADPSSPRTTAAFGAPGTYMLRLAASDGQLTGLDRVNVVVNPEGKYVVVDAGTDQTIRLPTTAGLQGAVTDGRVSKQAPLGYQWSVVSGPGAVAFTSPNAPATTASFSEAGVYVLRLSAGDPGYTGADDVTVNVRPLYPFFADDFNDNTPEPSKWLYTDPAIVERSGQLQFDVPNAFRLASLYSQQSVDMREDGAYVQLEVADYADPTPNPSSNRMIFWRMQGSEGNWLQILYVGGGIEFYKNETRLARVDNLQPRFWRYRRQAAADSFTFDTSDDGKNWSTRFTFTPPYTFPVDKMVFRLIPGARTAGAPGVIKFDNVESNIRYVVPNGFPTPVTGGPYVATVGLPLHFDGSRSFDPADIITDYVWEFGDGAQAGGPTPAHTYAAVGTYTARLTVTDLDGLTGSKTTTVRVLPPNQPPSVGAGDDQTIRLPATATLGGSVSDDGLPEGAAVTTQWSVVSGPGAVTFENAVALSTRAAFPAEGTYVLRLTATDSALSSSDDLTVVVEPAPPNMPPVVSAGADRAATPGVNLVRNGGGEEAPSAGQLPGWTKAEGSSWAQAPAGDSPFYESFEGDTYFHAPGDASAELRQDIDVSAHAGSLKAGAQEFEFKVRVRVAAEGTPDTARVVFELRDAGGANLLAFADTGDINTSESWHLVEGKIPAPADTRVVRVRLLATRRSGQTTDAYFDAVSVRALANAGVTLGGSVTDDGLPAGAAPTAAWSVVSGPGAVAFADASAASTAASFAAPGTYVLRLTGSDGVLTAADDVTVSVSPVNQSPSVNAGADQTITLPTATTALVGSVGDDGTPQGSSVSARWKKVGGPGAVTFADAAAASTEVTFAAPGNYVLRLTADDSDLSASDDLLVTVKPAPVNKAPVVEAGPSRSLSLPDAASLAGQAADDGLPSGSSLAYQWTKVSGPGAVNFSSPGSLATTAAFSAEGTYVLRLTADDSQLSASDELAVTVYPQGTNNPPAVSAGPDQEVRRPQQTAALSGSAADDGLPAGSALGLSWASVSGPGAVTFASPNAAQTAATFPAAGTYVLRLTANDSELSASDDVTVTVYDEPTGPAPSVKLSSLADGEEITAPKEVVGTVSSGAWRLEYALLEDETGAVRNWRTFASGTQAVTDGVLGRLDPTLLLNGTYAVRLITTDSAGRTSQTDSTVVVAGQMKVGNFTVSFTDLNMPLAGIPVQVTRTYDSRDKRRGDFGFGWTLGVTSVRVQKTTPVGANWHQTESFAGLRTYCLESTRPQLVTVTFGDGKVYKFRAAPARKCQRFQPQSTVQMTFTPMPGTRGTLTPLDGGPILVVGSTPGPVELVDISDPSGYYYNPTRFRLTTEDGTSFVIGQKTGVESVSTPAGETLTVTRDGITHSSGGGVAFVRDPQGRVSEMRDAEGRTRTYSYDASGDLSSFVDAEKNETRFSYSADHYLTAMEVRNADGTSVFKPIRNEYVDGRLVRQFDADAEEIRYEHDVASRREVIRDRLGHPTTYEYDDRGNVVYTKDAEGGETWRTYDERDNVLTERTAEGTTTNVYDAADNLTHTTDPYGNLTKYVYNAMRRVTSVTDPRNGVTTHEYHEQNGNLLRTVDAEGNETIYEYEPLGTNVLSITYVPKADPTHPRYTGYRYNRLGYLIRESNLLLHTVDYTTDNNGNRTTQIVRRAKPDGTAEEFKTTYDYDREGRLVKTIYPDKSFTSAVYNQLGKETSTKDRLGRETRYEYDAQGRLARTVYPGDLKEESGYDLEGRRTSSRDRADRLTAYKYDKVGRLSETNFADGGRTTTIYDALGRVLEQSRWLSETEKVTTSHRYAAEGKNRVVYVKDALGRETKQVFDEAGNLSRITDAKGRTTRYEYDKLNRRVKTVYHDTSFETTAYNAFGQVTAKTDQAARTTRFEYDAAGRLVKVLDAENKATAYGYDEQGNQTSQTDANLHTTRYEYDGLGQRTKRTLPEGMFELYEYDDVGMLKSRTDFNGKTTRYKYDDLGRLVEKTPDPSFGASPVTYTYTPTGRRETMADATGVTGYQYDPRDRLLTKATPRGTLSYTYDKIGSLKTVRSSNAGGVSVDYGYDALGRLSSVTDNRLAENKVTTYAYDEVGNLDSYTYGNGVKHHYDYSPLNRLTSLSVSRAGVTLGGYAYALGAAGNRESVTEANGRTVAYTYDALYRLTGESVSGDAQGVNGAVSYTYDDAGNRLSRTSALPGVAPQALTYDKNDRLTTDEYDPNGSTKRSAGVAYTYDWEDRLASVGGGAVAYAYDGDGDRVSKTVGGVTTQYLVDTNSPTGYAQVVEELRGGAVVRQYTYGSDLISQRQVIAGEWPVSYYGYDGHGSVRQLTDSAGAVTDAYTYDAFGILIARTGSTPNEYLYAGERRDAETGMDYLRARYMNPEAGRFWTMDEYEGSEDDPLTLHKYLYAGADPVDRGDPTGFFFGSIAEIGIANTVRSTLSNVQGAQGQAVMDQVRFGGNSGIKSLVLGGLILPVAIFGAAISVRVVGGFLRSGPALSKIPGRRGVIPNGHKDSPFELSQAREISQFRGGVFEGPPTSNFEGIDGWLTSSRGGVRIPASMKEYGAFSPTGVLGAAVKASEQAAKAGYSGVELFIRARNVRADDLAKFIPNGPLARIPDEGVISVIHIHTKDGWISLFGRGTN